MRAFSDEFRTQENDIVLQSNTPEESAVTCLYAVVDKVEAGLCWRWTGIVVMMTSHFWFISDNPRIPVPESRLSQQPLKYIWDSALSDFVVIKVKVQTWKPILSPVTGTWNNMLLCSWADSIMAPCITPRKHSR